MCCVEAKGREGCEHLGDDAGSRCEWMASSQQRLPQELWLYLYDETNSEISAHQSKLLSLDEFLEVVEGLSEGPDSGVSRVSPDRFLHLLKTNARHWAAISPQLPGKGKLYAWVARRSTTATAATSSLDTAVHAAKLLLHFTSNATPTELQPELHYALDVITADLCLQQVSSKCTLLQLKSLLVLVDRLPTLSPSQVGSLISALISLIFPSSASAHEVDAAAAAAAIGHSERWRNPGPGSSKQTEVATATEESDLSSGEGRDTSVGRRTTKHQVKLTALSCLESIVTVSRPG